MRIMTNETVFSVGDYVIPFRNENVAITEDIDLAFAYGVGENRVARVIRVCTKDNASEYEVANYCLKSDVSNELGDRLSWSALLPASFLRAATADEKTHFDQHHIFDTVAAYAERNNK